MVRTRQAKVDRIADSLPPLEVDDPDGDARVLVLGLGIDVRADRRRLPTGPQGRPLGRPGPPAPPQPVPEGPRRGAAERYDAVLVPEMNLGQLSLLLRAKYLVDVVGYNHVRGLPLKAAELAEAITDLIETTGDDVQTVDPVETTEKESVR